jgi:hypothetical protein
MTYVIGSTTYDSPTITSITADAVYGQPFTATVTFTTDANAGPGTVYQWNPGGMGVQSEAAGGVVSGTLYEFGTVVIPVSVIDANAVAAYGTVTVTVPSV